jgi:hypothetical protein
LNKQERRLKRDSELLEKIQGRSPEIFAEKSDTTTVEDSLSISMGTKIDTTSFREKLDQYLRLEEAKRDILNNDLRIEQRGSTYGTVVEAQKKVFHDLLGGGLQPFSHNFKDKNYDLNFSFNPKASLQFILKGTISYMVITNTKTITIKEYIYKEPTNWQAFKKMWPYIVIPTVILIGAVIKFIAG